MKSIRNSTRETVREENEKINLVEKIVDSTL
jgi:hypothetical protein